MQRIVPERIDIDGEWFDPELSHFAFPAYYQIEDMRSLENLAKFGQLTSATFSGTNLDDEGLSLVCRVTTLQSLDVQDTFVTNAGLESLLRLPHLVWLRLKDNHQLTDDSARLLSRLTTLEELSIQETSITEAGLSELHALPNLKDVCLEVWDGNFSFNGLLTLSQRMPACTFLAKGRGEFRAGSFEGTWS